jgi:parallel beta-helix repeat protein
MPVWTTATNLKGIGPGSAGQPWVSGGGAADPGYGTDFTWNGSHSWVLGASGILDLSAAAATGFKIPVVAGATPTAIGQIAYDSTANTYKGHNGSTPHTFAYTDSNISGTSAGAPWSGLSIPLANLALLTMGAYTTTFQHSATTGANNLWNWTDTASNTGTGYMHYINLASGSAMKPWFAGVNGVGIGVSNAGVLAAVGGGHVNADEAGGSAVGTAANANTAVACSSTNWSKGWTSGDNHCGAIAAADLPADLGTATTGHKLVAPIKCADTSASPTVYTCTTIPTFVPAVGDMLILSAVNQNSGATPTLAVNGGGNVGIYKWGGTAALASGDLQAGSSPVLTFDSNSHWEAQDIGNAPAGGAGNAADCTDTQAAGAITLTPTAGHVWCLGAGTFTSSGAISTAVSNFQIRGTGPATIIQFTGATAGFTFSGTDTLLSSLTMDGNSQATGGPLVTLAGTRNYVRNVTTKNFGTSHPAIYSEASDQAWVDAQVCPAPGIECIIFTGAAATNTTNFKITNGVYTSPGSSPPGSLVEVLQTSTNLIPTGGLVEGNTFLLHGGMALKFYGSQRLEQHRIVNNHVSGTGNSSDCFQFWQFSHNVVSGNTCRDNGFIVGGIALGDAYNNTFSNNSFYFSNAFTNGVIGLVDGSWNIFDGNNIDYGGTNSPFCAMNFGVSSAPFSYNIISHNNIYLSSGYAQVGICLHNQSSQVIQANLITDNIVSGTNQTGQIGVFLDIDTAGTTTLNTIANNSFYEVPVGVSIGTGVANTRFGENTCDTVAACISNAGTTTKINYTGGLPLATWTTPALAVGSSGYCTDCITSSVPTCAGSGGGTMIRMAAALACW